MEDPVEYRLPRINQVQVNSRIGLDFARVLRTSLRQDPDVIMIGEIRDKETAEIALRAAITGHLVLSTLHTNDAVSTVARLLDMQTEGYMIAAALQAVVAQRLLRRVCDSCAAPTTLAPQQQGFVSGMLSASELAGARFRQGAGCTYCSFTGYRGRIGVYELLELTAEMSTAIAVGDRAGIARALPADYRTLVQSGIRSALEGITTVDEVMRLAGSFDESAA